MKLFARNLLFFLAIITATLIPTIFFIAPMQGILSTKSAMLLSNQFYLVSFYIHVILGGIALLIGWVGFVDKIRNKYLNFHKISGRIYVVCFLITALTSILVSYHSMGGVVSQMGFMSVGVFAVFTTWKGYSAIVNKKIGEHQAWMRYSYACCLASVTLRLWSPLLGVIVEDGLLVYRIVAWLAWVPNIIVAYFINERKTIFTPIKK